MADNQKTQLFEEMPIPKAVMQLSIPTVLSSLVMVIYNLADTYFVGMLNNPVQNAAVTLAAPVLLAFNAVNNLFGVGSSSMMSRALGRRDYESVAGTQRLRYRQPKLRLRLLLLTAFRFLILLLMLCSSKSPAHRPWGRFQYSGSDTGLSALDSHMRSRPRHFERGNGLYGPCGGRLTPRQPRHHERMPPKHNS